MTRYGSTMPFHPDDLGVPIDAGAPVPAVPEPLLSYTQSYDDAPYLSRSGPLTLLRLGRVLKESVTRWETDLVEAAREAGIPDADIARVLETPRQNIARRFGLRGDR